MASLKLNIIVYLTLILIVLAGGTMGTYFIGKYYNGFNVPIRTPLEAAYFTVITVTTVGYGDIVPVSNTARIFVMALILSGIGVLISAVTLISNEFVNARVARITGSLNPFEKRMLKNHIVLVGTDSINMSLMVKLKEKNARFIALSSNQEFVAELRESGIKAFYVDETNEEQMRSFELSKAKSIIIDMRDKSHMVYAILLIRTLAEKSKIVVIAHSKEEETHMRSMGAGIGILNPFEMASNVLMQKLEELK